MNAGPIVGLSCGGVAGNVTDIGGGNYAVTVTCVNGDGFSGTVGFVNTGAPSDLVVKGAFTDFAGGVDAYTVDFSVSGYTLPTGPQVAAWEVMQGSMDLGNTSPGTDATLSEVSDLDGTCPTGGPTTGSINGDFNVSTSPVICNGVPPWTRDADYTASFTAGVSAGGFIQLGSGEGDNDWEGAPEPAPWTMLAAGGLLLTAGKLGLRRPRRG